jgi:hypothetical protein
MTTYPIGQEPDFWQPSPSVSTHRFALGRVAAATAADPPFIALCMNPSYADENVSDRTVNRIIEASEQFHRPGWLILNIYPERATRPDALHPYDAALSQENSRTIKQVVETFGVNEIFGAWGDLNTVLARAKSDVRAALARQRVSVYYLDDLTARNQPRHPTPRGSKLAMAGPKRYLNW